jgi:hypothetical protein
MEVGMIETLEQIKTEEELKTRIIGVIEEADPDQDRGQKVEREEENEVGGNEGPKVEVLMEKGIGGVEEVDQNHMRCAIEGKMTSVMRISDETGRKRACPR